MTILDAAALVRDPEGAALLRAVIGPAAPAVPSGWRAPASGQSAAAGPSLAGRRRPAAPKPGLPLPEA